jgi:hypothetical protein
MHYMMPIRTHVKNCDRRDKKKGDATDGGKDKQPTLLKPRKDPIGHLKDHIRACYEEEEAGCKTPKSPAKKRPVTTGGYDREEKMAPIIPPWEDEKRRVKR